MNDSITKEEVLSAYNNAPDFVRAAFNDEKTTQVIIGLRSKFQLHVDQAGALSKEIGYLLIGLINSEKFALRLKKDGFADDKITEIVKELNEKIFVPLRKEEEKGIVQPAKIAVPTPPPSTSQPVSHFKLENKIPLPRPAPQPQKNVPPPTVSKGALPPKAFLPRPSTLGEVVRSILAVPKPLDNSTLLEDHEEPHIELNKAEVPVNLPGVLPPVAQEIAPEVRPSPESPKVEPRMQPIIPIPVEVTPELPKVEPQIQPTVPAEPVAPEPITVTPITSYSSDPYREPVDEPPTK